jgi:hypothetical protein
MVEAEKIKALLSMLGIVVTGDLGPLTVYTTRRGRKVSYPRSPPTCPPTQSQLHQRARFADAQAAWARLDAQTKASWEQICLRLSMCATGQNAYMSMALTPNNAGLMDAISRSGITVPTPPPIP